MILSRLAFSAAVVAGQYADYYNNYSDLDIDSIDKGNQVLDNKIDLTGFFYRFCLLRYWRLGQQEEQEQESARLLRSSR